MDLQARVQLHTREFKTLEELNTQFLENKTPDEIDLRLFLLKREQCILQMKLQPILTADKMRLKLLLHTKASGKEQTDTEANLSAAYQNMLSIYQRVVKLEQAVAMRLRGLQKAAAQEQGIAKMEKKRVETYAQQLQRTVNIEAGSRFDRKR